MGSTAAKASLASPEVVAASALRGKISAPYPIPEDWTRAVSIGEGDGVKEEDRMLTAEEAIAKVIGQLDSTIDSAGKTLLPGRIEPTTEEIQLTEVLPGFPETVEGEILFCNADNISTDGIYPRKYTYQDDVTTEKMAEVVMQNYDL